VKAFKVQNPFAVLTMLLRDYRAAISNPQIARSVLFCRSAFNDSFIVAIVEAIRGANGDWRAALASLPRGFEVANFARLKKFRAWAEKASNRPVAGLLEWKGGNRA
jgi:hypothetical protein